MSLKYIFAQPDFVEDVGYIYPIRLKDYDEFETCSNILFLSQNHYEQKDIPLLTLLFSSTQFLQCSVQDLISNFEKLFSLALRTKVTFGHFNEQFWFKINKTHFITPYNYDNVRQIIMKQNLLFEQKIFKNKITQQWAEKALQARQKNAPKTTMEDMITTVSAITGKNYDVLENNTIYQLHADFYRIRKKVKYDTDTLFSTVSAEAINIEDFADKIDMFKSPYDDLFVSNDKLKKFNSITK